MTLSTTISRKQYAGNDATVSFPITFPWYDDSEINAVVTDANGSDTELTLNTDFTLSGGDGETGTLSYPVSGDPLATGETLTIYRTRELTQSHMDLSETGPFSAEVVEMSADIGIMIDQQQQEELDRCVKVAVTSTTDPDDYLTECEGYKDDAETAKTAAEAAQTAAELAETNAETAETNAETAEALAEKWANEDEDVVVDGGEYSAKHYSLKAAAAAASDSIKVSSNDTTPGYLGAKVTGGDGIAVAETNDGGDEDLDIDVDLHATPGLEFDGGKIRVKAGSNITVDASGVNATVPEATDTEPLEQDIIALAWILAETQGEALGLVYTVADAFEDEDDVDTTASTDEIYHSGDDYYINGPSSYTHETGGSAGGNMTGNGGLAASFDGNTSQASGSASCVASSRVDGTVGRDWGAGVAKTITKYEYWGTTNYGLVDGSSAITVALYGSNTAVGTDGVELHTDSFNDANSIHKTYTSGIITTTGYRYHWIKISGAGSAWYKCAELKLYTTDAVANMVLQSKTFTADSAPDELRPMIEIEEVDSITINTDLICAVTRDGGNNWTNATLTKLVETESGARDVYYAEDEVDVSGQPSDTDVRIRLTVANNKEIKVHRWGIQADQELSIPAR